VISNIAIAGDGASVGTRFAVANITSTGSVGDVTVRGPGGLGNLTASGIFGDISVTNGAITGTIQTTGVRIDPLTGAQTDVNGDIGEFTFGKTGAINGVTFISAKLGISGQIISRGNLISAIKAKGFSGLIAAQGDIGAMVNAPVPAAETQPASPLARFGGISISGNDSGEIVALGNVFGDLKITGTLSGRIAVRGQAVAGLDSGRDGILGNLQVGKFAGTGAIISGGLIADAEGGTSFTSSAIKSGFLAADGDINFAKGVKVTTGSVFADSQGTADGAVMDAIFTAGSSPLQFDTGGTLTGLALIQADVKGIGVVEGALSGTIP
jgi:hypothetical protein